MSAERAQGLHDDFTEALKDALENHDFTKAEVLTAVVLFAAETLVSAAGDPAELSDTLVTFKAALDDEVNRLIARARS